METSKITLAGMIYGLSFSHKTMGEDFFKANICVYRKSENYDELRLIVPSIIAEKIENEKEYLIYGSIRTRNAQTEGNRKLEVYVFVNEILDYPGYDINEVELRGYICKQPTFRKTPFGRQITDFLMAVNRPTGKSDYIPCIAWGRSAERMESLEIGTEIKIKGRIQSRIYNKRISETDFEERTAYEVSTYSFEILEECNGSKLEEDR